MPPFIGLTLTSRSMRRTAQAAAVPSLCCESPAAGTAHAARREPRESGRHVRQADMQTDLQPCRPLACCCHCQRILPGGSSTAAAQQRTHPRLATVIGSSTAQHMCNGLSAQQLSHRCRTGQRGTQSRRCPRSEPAAWHSRHQVLSEAGCRRTPQPEQHTTSKVHRTMQHSNTTAWQPMQHSTEQHSNAAQSHAT